MSGRCDCKVEKMEGSIKVVQTSNIVMRRALHLVAGGYESPE